MIRFSRSTDFGEGGALVNGQQVHCVSSSSSHSNQMIKEHYNAKGVFVQSVTLVDSYCDCEAGAAMSGINKPSETVLGYARGIIDDNQSANLARKG